MDELGIIRRARQRIRRGWTQNAYARDRDGVTVDSNSPEASCWCVMGALGEDVADFFAQPDVVVSVYCRLHRLCEVSDIAEENTITFGSLSDWNDYPDRTKKEVLEVFKKAEQEILAEKSNG
jgi:hypothetical protein